LYDTSVDIILNSDVLHSLIYTCTNYYHALYCVIDCSDDPHLVAFALDGFHSTNNSIDHCQTKYWFITYTL